MCASKNFCILIASCAAYFSLVLLIRVLCLILSNFSLYHCRLLKNVRNVSKNVNADIMILLELTFAKVSVDLNYKSEK